MANLSYIKASKLADLLRSTDPEKKMNVWVLNATRLAVGEDPLQPSRIIDLSSETTGPFASSETMRSATAPIQNSPHFNTSRATRRGGEYWFEINGRKTNCSSLKHLLAEALRAIEKAKPGTLDILSRQKGRSRRIVARDPAQLFDKPHLVEEYAEPLGDGWYFGTNNSARETSVWLQRAAECAGLKLGANFKISL